MIMAVATQMQTKTSPFYEILNLGGEVSIQGLSKQQFIELASKYPELLMEREKNGKINIMAPVKGGSGHRENRLSFKVNVWQDKVQEGMVFSPSTGFDLPDGATKSPDIAWVSDEKISQLTLEEIEEEFVPVVPDFIVEIRSKTDRLPAIKKKVKETWIANGVRLAWLIDPYKEKAYIFRTDGTEEIVEGFDNELSGENVMPGFVLSLKEFRLLNNRK